VREIRVPEGKRGTFYFTGKEWVATPFENAPKGLRHNILQSYPISGDGSIVHANDQAKQPAKWNTIGVVLTERFIPQHIEWEHSCPRINPIASPEETQSVNQFLSLSSKPLVVKVLSAHHDVIRIDRVEDYRSIFAQRKFKDEFVIKDCDGKIGRAESSSPWIKQPGGLMISRPTAIRIELLAASKEKMNIWLPYAEPNGGHPSRIQCVGNKGYALINHWGKGTVELTIAQLDLTGGTWTNVWRFAYPPADFKDRGIIDFNETSGGFQLTVGEINHTNSRHEGEPWATIGARYVLDIRHSPNHLAK
jgi:hypothetical protein